MLPFPGYDPPKKRTTRPQKGRRSSVRVFRPRVLPSLLLLLAVVFFLLLFSSLLFLLSLVYYSNFFNVPSWLDRVVEPRWLRRSPRICRILDLPHRIYVPLKGSFRLIKGDIEVDVDIEVDMHIWLLFYEMAVFWLAVQT